jgi:hypothetical protein
MRSVLLRSLPALLVVLLALVAAPQRATAGPRPAAGSAVAVEPSPERPDAAAESTADAGPVPADRVTVLSAQFTAGVRGSRAPPAVLL